MVDERQLAWLYLCGVCCCVSCVRLRLGLYILRILWRGVCNGNCAGLTLRCILLRDT